MSSLLNKLSFTQSSRVTTGVLVVALAAVGTAIYLTPSGAGGATGNDAANKIAVAPASTPTPATAAPAPAPTPKAKPKPTAKSSSSAAPKPVAATSAPPVTTVEQTVIHTTEVDVVHAPPKTDVVVVKTPAPAKTKIVTKTAPPKPVVTVKVPTKAELVNPATKYYGLAEDGLPGSASLYDSLDRSAGKAPNLVEWFAYWDDSYSPQKVTQAWDRGALPVITWQSAPHDYANHAVNLTNYSMANIAAGLDDSYLKTFATSVLDTGLPVGIRLDQEMNGNWYPWSAGYNSRGIHNTPAQFVAAWQHIWNVFQSVGANRYVIWTWTPSRTDTLIPDSTTSYSAGDTGLVEDYPGDGYVDWMGLSAYQFRPTDPATYDWIFGGTLNGNNADVGLKQVSGKPIFIAEWGSAQTIGTSTDNTANKVALTTTALAQFASDPRIVGFSLFNNDVTGVHAVKVNGVQVSVETNWQFDSSPEALAAFQQGVANPVYGSGVGPLPVGTTVQLSLPKDGS